MGEEARVIENRPWYTYRQAAKRTGKHVQTMKKWRQRSPAGWSWDNQGRRVVEHQALMAYWRGCIDRDNRNRHVVELALEQLLDFEETTGDTP